MDEQLSLSLGDLPPQLSNLRTIEGGRAIAERNVQASLAVDADALSCTDNIAGYCIVVWDDQGGLASTVHLGSRNPYSPAMLPSLVGARVAADMVQDD